MTKTTWYPGSIHPVNEGWYECTGLFYEGTHSMRKWKNGQWWWRPRQKDALRPAAVSRFDKWRGLTK